MKAVTEHDVTAVVLAGGRGSRMDGKDKGLVELAGRRLIEHVIDAIEPQVNTVIVNANRNRSRYLHFGYPVIADDLDGYQGPLAGFYVALANATTSHVITLPCDGPLVPDDLVSRMISSLTDRNADIAVAHDGTRMQPVYALMPTSLGASLKAFLDAGERKIDIWYRRHRIALTDFSDRPDTFRNINTDEQRTLFQKQGLLA